MSDVRACATGLVRVVLCCFVRRCALWRDAGGSRVAAPYGGTLVGFASLRLMAGRWLCGSVCVSVAAPDGGTRVVQELVLSASLRLMAGCMAGCLVRLAGVGRSRHIGFAARGSRSPLVDFTVCWEVSLGVGMSASVG
jgi:hypothetical protein